jgi:hypothetical protein
MIMAFIPSEINKINKGENKVKFTLKQAMKTQRESRGISLLFP